MTVLRKNTRITYTPGSSGVPASPGRPARPAYCETRDYEVTVPTGYYATNDGNSNRRGETFFVVTGYRKERRSVTTCYPADAGAPPVAGTPGTPAQFSTDYNLGWNAGAVTIDQITGDGAFKFSLDPGVVGVVIGLNDINESAGYLEINYGFYFNDTGVVVMEAGVAKTGLVAYASADVFTVHRRGAVVSYYQGSTLLYTSSASSAGTLFGDVSMYSGGDAVRDASFAPISLGTSYALTGLQPFTGFAGAGSHADAITSLQPLTGSASGRAQVTVASVLQPLITVASNKPYAESRGVLSGFTTEASAGMLAPSYAISNGSLAYLLGAGHGLTGTLGNGDTSLSPLITIAADHAYAESRGQMAPITGEAYQFPSVDGTAFLVQPRSSVYAAGSEAQANAFRGKMKYSLTGYFGGNANLRSIAHRLLATGVGVVIGRAYLTAPRGTLAASGKAGAIGRAAMSQPRSSLRGNFGGYAVLNSPRFTVLAGHGIAGGIGEINLTQPRGVLSAFGTAKNYGVARLTGPALRPVASGIARLTSPRGTLLAVASLSYVTAYEAYAVNLIGSQYDKLEGAVTRYTNYPFNQIVRFGNRYIGVADDGLFELGGDEDDCEVIPWSFRTHLTDLKSKQFKRVHYAYVSGRTSHSSRFDYYTGEDDSTDKYTTPPLTPGPRSTRVTLPKGLRSRFIAFGLSDQEGGAADISSIDLEITELGRAI